MENTAALDWFIIFAGTFGVFWMMCHVVTKALPRAFKTIRQWWHDSAPDDNSNHR